MVMNQTPSTRLVWRLLTTWGRPTTIMLESSVAMKMPTVVTVRTTHLYSNNQPPIYQASPGCRPEKYKTPQQREQDIPRIESHSGDSPRISPDQQSGRGVPLNTLFTLEGPSPALTENC